MTNEEIEKYINNFIRCEDEYTGAIYAGDGFFIAFSTLSNSSGIEYDLYDKDNFIRSYRSFDEVVVRIKKVVK